MFKKSEIEKDKKTEEKPLPIRKGMVIFLIKLPDNFIVFFVFYSRHLHKINVKLTIISKNKPSNLGDKVKAKN